MESEGQVDLATKHKQSMRVAYPPFSVFVKFLENTAEMKNDPAFQYEKKGARNNKLFRLSNRNSLVGMQ